MLGASQIGDHYHVIKKLGQGTFSHVLLARERISGHSVALKFVRKDRTRQAAFLHELNISISLSDYPGIIKTYPTYIETLDYFIFTQELAPAGTLHSIIESEVGIPEEVVKRCAVQITAALDYIHGRGLVHRDLKPDNVLLMDKECYHIKLCDFGFTQNVGFLVPSMSHIIPYMPPELCSLKPNHLLVLGPSMDIWSLGILLFVALTGYFPWEEALGHNQKYQLFVHWKNNRNYVPTPILWDRFTQEALDMFLMLLSEIPCARHPPDTVLKFLHFPWMAKNNSDGLVVEGDLNIIILEDNNELPVIEYIIQEQEQVIVVENTDDIEFMYVDNAQMHLDPNNPVIMLLSENTSLSLGSEIDIT
ncbi:hypothetical protein XENTR_v10015046 [Xenopus tropicalis]|uniref:SH3 domain binding kinase 1 like n=3 Tax=Xenopus tropicalis TaxID=8364 RepID=F6ZIA8_XENTR|nr:serine/threonine-protein kinase SBK1 [Xenopus tropicalis]KAE8605266.1 hypothetical protein XENTR_v10015046 [Xenopus tropicalis]KAE8605267.1 hypothetical protein XENTR_v10015046 [Xenopus tropicalis]KAE8605268.1 hypothetical protein XENTR_v10015046 [Xenopus tropicalis]KAE8605269.1 hypothetical protein XENTR_v10015046 [Xenopus tropicalis]|eukprot:XP_002936027.1 PREDICTED: serine/threonine-protein kinase SBK1-like [Xenopus tropicalis]